MAHTPRAATPIRLWNHRLFSRRMRRAPVLQVFPSTPDAPLAANEEGVPRHPRKADRVDPHSFRSSNSLSPTLPFGPIAPGEKGRACTVHLPGCTDSRRSEQFGPGPRGRPPGLTARSLARVLDLLKVSVPDSFAGRSLTAFTEVEHPKTGGRAYCSSSVTSSTPSHSGRSDRSIQAGPQSTAGRRTV